MEKLGAFLLLLLPFAINAQNGACIPPVTAPCSVVANYIDSVVFTEAIIPNNYTGTGCNGAPQNYQIGGYGVMDDGNDSFRIRVGVNPNVAAYIGIWIAGTTISHLRPTKKFINPQLLKPIFH